ncbi:hypothetical protein J7394_09920 [Ruegeria sp. R13_0]|uniref:hypothetical protein n=1 Tax=Ruegeria sp. R13_0 TaxID=2821099 RepID=UPI001ADA5A0B|nr:hypothetical protein [Ruegeria sp. R13_0]MBO9434522.1 hypothetical protein [Ruegeria sp. R13_0]
MKFVVNKSALPEFYPTHRHEPKFWESLGRVVATFGFLEEVLGKAIFVITGTKQYPEEEIEAELEKWRKTLERAVSDPLGGLINEYVKAVETNPDATITNIEAFEKDLRNATRLRNALCHGSWRAPNADGASRLFYVEKKDMQRFDSAVDTQFLLETQRHAAELAAEVINTVTSMGFQFPGSEGPGQKIWN